MARAAKLLLTLLLLLVSAAAAASPSSDAEVISRFQEYLRIDTMQPAPDYAATVAPLRDQAASFGLEARTLELVAGKLCYCSSLARASPCAAYPSAPI